MYTSTPRPRDIVRSLLVITAFASLASLAGCGGSGGGGGDDAPAPSGVVGSWTGSISSSSAGSGTAALDITEEMSLAAFDSISTARGMYGTAVSGFWLANFSGDINDNGGTFTGTNIDGTINGTVEPFFDNGCPFTFSATLIKNDATGTFSAFDCTVDDNGTFSLTRQPENLIRDIDGLYSGSITSNLAGTGTTTVDIIQTGVIFTGRMSADFAGSTFDIAGTIAGTIDGNSIEMKFFPDSFDDCPFSATGTIDGSNTIDGSFAAFSCLEIVTGSFSISR